MRFKYYFLLLLMGIAPALSGQNPDYQYYDINEIASKELIKSVARDDQGYIWLATDQGVLNFDGVRTDLYYKELPTPYAKTFIQRQSGQFLVLHDQGLKEIVHNPDTTWFKPFRYGPDSTEAALNYPKTVYEDKEGDLWIGEFNAVVRIYPGGLKRFELGGAFQSINYHRSFAFTEDAFGNLWIAPYKGPLLSYDAAKDILHPMPYAHPISNVSCIVSVKGDHLLIGGREGVLKLKIDSDKQILESNFIPCPAELSAGISIDESAIFFGSWEQGMFAFDFKRNTLEPVEQVPFNDMLDFYYDEKENELWIAGSENVGLLRSSNVGIIHASLGQRIESISASPDGTIFYSTGEEIFRLRDNRREKIFSAESTFFDRILVEKDLIWIGDAFGSVSNLNLSTGTAKTFQDNTGQGILQIFKDDDNNKWFTGDPDRILKIDNRGGLTYYDQVKNAAVVRQSGEGKIVCGGKGKNSLLYEYDPPSDSFTPLRPEFTFPATEDILVEDIAFDETHTLWLGTSDGLLKIERESDGQYRKARRIGLNGFDEDEPVRALFASGNTLWLANSHGLVVYHNDYSVFYTTENGLPSKILKSRGLTEATDHSLLVATAKGIAKVEAASRELKETPAPVFTSLQVNGRKAPLTNGGNEKFPYKARIEAEFASLSYPASLLTYQTRILGMDDEWSGAAPNRNISIIGFEEGDYTLEVRARMTGRLWSAPVQRTFSVANPWFRTWWAYLLFAGLLVGFTVISVKIYNKRLIRQKKKLQMIIEARTAEINRQKNEIIEQKNKIIQQKEELLDKNKAIYESQKALSEADLKYLHLKEKQLQDQIEFKNKQITTHTLNIIQKNTTLKELRNKLELISKSHNGTAHQELKKSLRIIDESFRLDKDWEEFRLYFEQIYTGFYAKLKVNYPELTTHELRHCALIRLNLSNAECASILGVSADSVKVSRSRLRKKLKLPPHGNLTDFIISI